MAFVTLASGFTSIVESSHARNTDKNNNTSDQHHASLFQISCQCFRNINSRKHLPASRPEAADTSGLLYRNCKLQYSYCLVVIIACHLLLLKTALSASELRQASLPSSVWIGITYYLKISVSQQGCCPLYTLENSSSLLFTISESVVIEIILPDDQIT